MKVMSSVGMLNSIFHYSKFVLKYSNTILNLVCTRQLLHAHVGDVPRFGAVGGDVGQINEVTLRRARLILGWVTVSGFNSWCGKFISV